MWFVTACVEVEVGCDWVPKCVVMAIGYEWYPRVWWCQVDAVGARVWLWQLDVFDAKVSCHGNWL